MATYRGVFLLDKAMNGMPWFRMYHEMIDDPKVGTLNDSEFRTWVELLCLACAYGNHGSTGLTEDEISWKLRRNVSETFLKLFRNGLVTVEDDIKCEKAVKIVNWDKRQFSSDCSSDRVRKYRKNNNKNYGNVSETFLKRRCNGDVTAQDTDTDTDIKKEEKKDIGLIEKKTPTLSPIKAYEYPDWLNRSLWSDFCRMRSRIKKPITTERTINGLLSKLKEHVDKGYTQDEIIQAAIDHCWQSFFPPKTERKIIDYKHEANMQACREFVNGQ